MKWYLIVLSVFLVKAGVAQYDFCPIDKIWAKVDCQTQTNPKAFVQKDIVRDFNADPSGRQNSHQAFECAALYFNRRGGNGRLIIPYGTYKVGNQGFIHADSSSCNTSNNYGWVGKDLMHLVACNKIEIIGVKDKKTGKPPLIYFQDSIKIGGFTQAGQASTFTNYNEAEKRFRLPANCLESKKQNTYTAFPGSFFWFEDCTNISVSNLRVDGSSQHAQLGSFHGTGSAPYELWGYGMVVWNSKKVILKDLSILNQCMDGMLIKNYTDSGILTKSYQVQISRVRVSGSGRNNISWVGGNGVNIDNSWFGLAGNGKIKTDPGAGLDIEPETHELRTSKCSYTIVNNKWINVNDICINSNIKNSTFYENRLTDMLIASDSVRVKNVFFSSCVFNNSKQWSLRIPDTNLLLFKNCKIYGKWYVNEKPFLPLSEKLGFINCIFNADNK